MIARHTLAALHTVDFIFISSSAPCSISVASCKCTLSIWWWKAHTRAPGSRSLRRSDTNAVYRYWSIRRREVFFDGRGWVPFIIVLICHFLFYLTKSLERASTSSGSLRKVFLNRRSSKLRTTQSYRRLDRRRSVYPQYCAAPRKVL